MKKTIVVLTGIYMLSLSCFLILIEFVSSINIIKHARISGTHHYLLVIVLIILPFIVCSSVTGIGLLMFRNWSRYFLSVLSLLAIILGGLFSALFVSIPFHAIVNPTVVMITRVLLVLISLFFLIILPLFHLVFFSRKTVSELFNASLLAIKHPLGITVLAILAFTEGLLYVFLVFGKTSHPVPIFGFIFISGWTLRIYRLVVTMIKVYIAYGFWKLRKSAWVMWVGIGLYSIINSVFIIFAMNDKILYRMNPTRTHFLSSEMMKFLYGYGALFVLVILIFVIRKHGLFFQRNLEKDTTPLTVMEA